MLPIKINRVVDLRGLGLGRGGRRLGSQGPTVNFPSIVAWPHGTGPRLRDALATTLLYCQEVM